MQTQIERQVTHYITIANHYFDIAMPMPKICFNQRGKVAGSAWLQKWEIRFNPVLMQDNLSEFLHQVVPHEVAHLIVFHLYQNSRNKPKPHGKEWKFIMQQVFSRPATTRHNFDISKTQGKTFSYQCGCQTHQLSIIRHNKVQRGTAKYHCYACKQELVYSESD